MSEKFFCKNFSRVKIEKLKNLELLERLEITAEDTGNYAGVSSNVIYSSQNGVIYIEK